MRKQHHSAALTYEALEFHDGYLDWTLRPQRLRSFRLHLGEETIPDEDGGSHLFHLIWFRATGELIAVEIEETFGHILPLNRRLCRSTDRYLYLGNFSEEGIDELLVHQGYIIKHLWVRTARSRHE